MTDSVDGAIWRKEAAAHKRAMPLPRLTGNGMDYADYAELYARVDRGEDWADVAAGLGDRNRERAEQAFHAGHRATAQSWYLFAAACYRAAQVPLPDDDPRKIAVYRKLIRDFGCAGSLSDPPMEHVEIDNDSGAMCGWLMRPPPHAGSDGVPPVVIVLGGFDGWREEYHTGAVQLVQRGLAVLLIDGPGQGETRLMHGLHMDMAVHEAFSAVVDHLLADSRLAPTIGVWGNSMGGYLAALTAAHDDRIAACCVNGGTVRPAEILDRYPRFITKVMPLLGADDPDQARAELERYRLTPELLGRLSCPLLVLHGKPDKIFLASNARLLYDNAASVDKTYREWPDGDHCIYNHSHEKHVTVADWFADRLLKSFHPRTATSLVDTIPEAVDHD